MDIREWGRWGKTRVYSAVVWKKNYDESLKVHTIPLFRLEGGPVFSCAASLVYTQGGTKKSRELYSHIGKGEKKGK